MTTNLNAIVQAAASGMMAAMVISTFASALGILMVATPMTAIPRETKATRRGLQSLRDVFGVSVVDRAVKEVGKDDVVALAMKVEELVGIEAAEKKIKAKARPVIDTNTSVQYRSEYAAGKAVAAEYGFDPDDHFVWYKIIKQDPDRFRRV